MKLFRKRFLSGILAVVMISSFLCMVASAAVKSSEYLDAYNAILTAKSNGAMLVTVGVEGVGRMTEIGATTIYIYESTDSKNFTRVKTYEKDDYPEMIGSGSLYYEDVVTYPGTVGRYYYAVVYVYAGNANGSDSRRITTPVKQAIA